EPTSAMDALNEDIFYKNLLLINNPIIFISHRMSSCKMCDNIIVLKNGLISQFGTHNELVNCDGKYKELWLAQAETYINF
ncbi:MAG: ABC transporter ATP-binding protein, partial [bacterium]